MRGPLLLFSLAACGADASLTSRTFDPCDRTAITAATATVEQLASIDAAIATWHARGVVGLARGEAAALQVEFREAAASIYGYYDDTTATLYVNLRIDDPTHRAITIAHELGHALGLEHVAPETRPSVMNPGNLTIAPNEGDAAALAALWGACAVP